MAADARLSGAITSFSTEDLLIELLKRQDDTPAPDTKPKCGSAKIEAYDIFLHVTALILILIISTFSCAFPLFSRRRSAPDGATPRLRTLQRKILFICQHFGTGVLLATAFVHLLPTAFMSLTDPCLPDFWTKIYQPMAGLIAMVSALVVVAVESYLTTRGARHSHSHDTGHGLWDEDSGGGGSEPRESAEYTGMGEVGGSLAAKRQQRPVDIVLGDLESQGLVAGASPLPETTPVAAGAKPKFDDEVADDDDLSFSNAELAQRHSASPTHRMRHDSAMSLHDPEQYRKLVIQVFLLEAGILFHSIFIGMALSIAQGPTFVAFLCAICLHQSFEGLALGSRIATIAAAPRGTSSFVRPWLMVLAFGCTTPIGQAIGLAMHELYDPRSQAGLLVVGIMNAISSGLLLFAGLVQLLAADFLSEKSYENLTGKRRRHAYLAVIGGATVMAAVGAVA